MTGLGVHCHGSVEHDGHVAKGLEGDYIWAKAAMSF